MEVGAKLQEARETQNLTLDQVQETTKIQKRYLQAIEQGDFHILPGKFYARAFIKEYAYAVGLDPEELLTDYKDEIPSTEDNDSIEYHSPRRSRRESSSKRSTAIFSFMPTVIVVLLVIGIVFVAWTLVQKNASNSSSSDPVNDASFDEVNKNVEDEDETDSATDDENQESDEEEENTEDTELPETTSEFSVIEIGTGNSPESTMQLTNVGEEVEVSLQFSGETYLQVITGSGETLLDGMYSESNSPEELTISGEEKIYFNIGYSLHTDITINGIELEYPVDPESSVHQKLWIHLNEAE